MANTASTVRWPSGPAETTSQVGEQESWVFYSQVSVSGPTVTTTVHRGSSVHGSRASLTSCERQADPVPEDDYKDPVVGLGSPE